MIWIIYNIFGKIQGKVVQSGKWKAVNFYKDGTLHCPQLSSLFQGEYPDNNRNATGRIRADNKSRPDIHFFSGRLNFLLDKSKHFMCAG